MRLRWIGHVERMEEERMPKRLMKGEIIERETEKEMDSRCGTRFKANEDKEMERVGTAK